MESPGAVDDDICILKHECVFVPSESPVSVCSGDESVASHFALVTAYEDIKKRLRDSERENTILRRRIKQLEDRHFHPEAPPAEGPQYMNKAFSAYRGIYIEKEDLQQELNKVKKEKMDLERHLTEQLQAKELEVLQLRTEMETSQVMKSLTADSARDHWSQMEIQSLEQQLKRLQTQNNTLHALDVSENSIDESSDALMDCRSVFQHLLGEVWSLRSAVHSQSELLKKMKFLKMTDQSICRQGVAPVQCLDTLYPLSSSPLPLDPLLNGAMDSSGCAFVSRPAPLGHTEGFQTDLRHSNLEADKDWSFPSAPRPNQSNFWIAPADSNLLVAEAMPETP